MRKILNYSINFIKKFIFRFEGKNYNYIEWINNPNDPNAGLG